MARGWRWEVWKKSEGTPFLLRHTHWDSPLSGWRHFSTWLSCGAGRPYADSL